MSLALDSGTALRATAIAAAVAVVVDAAETFAAERARTVDLTPYEVVATRLPMMRLRPLPLLARIPVLAVIALRCLCAALLSAGWPAPALVAAVLAAMSMSVIARRTYGLDGADHMLLVVLVALALAYSTGSGTARAVVVWLIAGEAALAYTTAGIAKLIAPGWRDGTFLPQILHTKIYGCPPLAAALSSRPAAARVACNTLLFWECTFPVALIAPRPVALAYVAAGACFHVTTALVMGLNTFMFSFLAAYPCLLAVALR